LQRDYVFAPPPLIQTKIFVRLPDELRIVGAETAVTRRRGQGTMDSLLEGPSFDRQGVLYCVDIAHGRIFRISPRGDWETFAHYDGEPTGLKIHKDGRIFVADAKFGLLCFDPGTAARTIVCAGPEGGGFRGLNDLIFADNGDLYLTDPGDSALETPTGRVFRLRASGELDLLYDHLAFPNGLVLDLTQTALFVAVTRALQVIRIPLRLPDGGVYKCGVFLQLPGGLVGPDGMAIDEDGNLAVVQAGLGCVWIVSPRGEPLARVHSCAGGGTTNIAFGGPERKTLFITEAERGVVLQAQWNVPGRLMYSHQ
jgi:gluconolactonase